jgi:MoxR-like ATPase
VLATQNPIEHEGTYPLPEAQLDRFFFNILIDYPSKAEESEIVKQTTGSYEPELSAVLASKEIIKLQELVRRVPVSDYVVDYAIRLVSETRPKDAGGPEALKDLISWGAGPRASQALIVGSKARAILDGRLCASVEDVQEIAYTVLRHRVVLSFKAEADGITADNVVEKLLSTVKPK